MAVPPKTDAAFLREVDEELRRDQMSALVRKYGIAAAVGVLALLAALAGFLYWQSARVENAGLDGEKLQKAYDEIESNRSDAAAKPLAELANSRVEGYRATARLTQADLLLQKKDLKAAAAKFAEVANDNAVAQPFRDLALIRQTAVEYDALKPEVVINRLKPLAVAGNPWFGSAGELVAGAYLRQNRRDLAGKLFGEIARNDEVPDTLRQRAVQMAGVLGVDAVVQNEEAKAK